MLRHGIIDNEMPRFSRRQTIGHTALTHWPGFGVDSLAVVQQPVRARNDQSPSARWSHLFQKRENLDAWNSAVRQSRNVKMPDIVRHLRRVCIRQSKQRLRRSHPVKRRPIIQQPRDDFRNLPLNEFIKLRNPFSFRPNFAPSLVGASRRWSTRQSHPSRAPPPPSEPEPPQPQPQLFRPE